MMMAIGAGLACVLIVVLVNAYRLLKLPYETFYEETTSCFDPMECYVSRRHIRIAPAVETYLGVIREECKARLTGVSSPAISYVHHKPEDRLDRYPENPGEWQTQLEGSADRRIGPNVAATLLIGFVLLMTSVAVETIVEKGHYYLIYKDDGSPLSFSAGLLIMPVLAGVIAVFAYVSQAWYVHGLHRGYLEGYAQGFEAGWDAAHRSARSTNLQPPSQVSTGVQASEMLSDDQEAADCVALAPPGWGAI